MAPWWWFLREPKHVGATVGIFNCSNIPVILWLCASVWNNKSALMHKSNLQQAISDFACLILYNAELLQTPQTLLQKKLLFRNHWHWRKFKINWLCISSNAQHGFKKRLAISKSCRLKVKQNVQSYRHNTTTVYKY
jgi:hypothetical protein